MCIYKTTLESNVLITPSGQSVHNAEAREFHDPRQQPVGRVYFHGSDDVFGGGRGHLLRQNYE